MLRYRPHLQAFADLAGMSEIVQVPLQGRSLSHKAEIL